MKPDDILNAIGDVEEQYVKKARRKERLKGFLAAATTMAVLMFIVSTLVQTDYILLRINPDFSVNTGYVDPAHLVEDHWSTLEQTGYENGQAVSSTVFKRTLYDNYTITHVAPDGKITVLTGSAGGDSAFREYLGPENLYLQTMGGGDLFRDYFGERELYLHSMLGRDLIDRIDTVIIHQGDPYQETDTLRNFLRIEYLQNGIGDDWVMKQSHMLDDGTVTAYRSFEYTNSRLSKTRDYDGDGTVLGYAEYTYRDTDCTKRSYTAEGSLAGSSESTYDLFGRLSKRAHYDAAGNLVGTEVYHYRVLERYWSIEGLITLFIILCLSAFMGVEIYEGIRLPLGKRGARLSEAPTPAHPPKSVHLKKIEEVRVGLREVSALLQSIEPADRTEAIKEVHARIEQLNQLLSDETPPKKE